MTWERNWEMNEKRRGKQMRPRPVCRLRVPGILASSNFCSAKFVNFHCIEGDGRPRHATE